MIYAILIGTAMGLWVTGLLALRSVTGVWQWPRWRDVFFVGESYR